MAEILTKERVGNALSELYELGYRRPPYCSEDDKRQEELRTEIVATLEHYRSEAERLEGENKKLREWPRCEIHDCDLHSTDAAEQPWICPECELNTEISALKKDTEGWQKMAQGFVGSSTAAIMFESERHYPESFGMYVQNLRDQLSALTARCELLEKAIEENWHRVSSVDEWCGFCHTYLDPNGRINHKPDCIVPTIHPPQPASDGGRKGEGE